MNSKRQQSVNPLKTAVNRESVAVWLIRAGSMSEAEKLLLDSKRLALGPAKVGDVSDLHDREEYKNRFRMAFPEATGTSIGGGAGQLFRFVIEAKKDDVVVYPSKRDGMIHMGLISGEYQYRSKDSEYPHQRKVRWIGSVKRSEMSQMFLNEARAFKSFYRLSKSEGEIMARINELKSQASVDKRS